MKSTLESVDKAVVPEHCAIRVVTGCVAVLLVTGCVYLFGTYVQYRNGVGSGWRRIFDQQRISKAELETLVLGIDEYHRRTGLWPESNTEILSMLPELSTLLNGSSGDSRYLVDYSALKEVGFVQEGAPVRIIAIQVIWPHHDDLGFWFVENDPFRNRLAALSDGRIETFGVVGKMLFRGKMIWELREQN